MMMDSQRAAAAKKTFSSTVVRPEPNTSVMLKLDLTLLEGRYCLA